MGWNSLRDDCVQAELEQGDGISYHSDGWKRSLEREVWKGDKRSTVLISARKKVLIIIPKQEL